MCVFRVGGAGSFSILWANWWGVFMDITLSHNEAPPIRACGGFVAGFQVGVKWKNGEV